MADQKLDSLEIREVDVASSDAQYLIQRLDQNLGQWYQPEEIHGIDAGLFHEAGGVFVIAFEAATPVGCGALRPYSDTEVEIKRMFVLDSYRGRGISRRLLEFLEGKSTCLGFQSILLETGVHQVEALGLYRSSGYEPIDRYGEYRDNAHSHCFRKNIVT